MDQIIKEAFQELKMMNEDTFSFDKEGLSNLSKFLKADNQISTLNVIDPTAQTEEDLLPDYTGKVILQCCVCNQPIYANPEEVDVDEETQRVNVGKECPHCYSLNGYKVIGQVQPFVDDEIRATVDGEEVEIEEKEEIEESLNESWKDEAKSFGDIIKGKGVTFTGIDYDDAGIDDEEEIKEWDSIIGKHGVISGATILNGFERDKSKQESFEDCYWDVTLDNGEELEGLSGLTLTLDEPFNDYDESLKEDTIKQNGKWVNKGKEGTHGTFRTKKAADAQRKAMFANNYKESLKLNEKKQKDLWDEIYSELTFSDDQRWSTDDAGKAHNKIHQGYYDYMDQMGIDYEDDGTPLITIKAVSEDDLSKAKEIADGYKDRGVTYSVNQDKYNKRFPYKLKIKVPMEESLNESSTDLTRVIVGEEDIHHFDDETGDIIITSNAVIAPTEGERFLLEFDDEEVVPQEYQFVRETEDGYQFEYIGEVSEESLSENLEDKYAYALTKDPTAKYNYLIGKDIKEAEDNLKSNGFNYNGYKDISEDQTEWYYAGWDDSVILTTQGEDDIVTDAYYKEPKNESLEEDFTKATVETGESVLSMESDDKGKVTVTSEPRKVEESGEGILAPVSDDTKKEIESNEEESEVNEEEIAELDEIDLEGDSGANEVEVEDIEEEGFNELGESYLKEVYDNVKSFKTIKGSINESKIKLEGIIEFNSGKKAKTNFIFESAEITKKGKVKFVGGNPQISKKPNAFTLQGTLKDHTLIVESLTYNYRAQDAKSNSNFSKYGTVKRKIVRG